MKNQVELVADGNGVVVVGKKAAVTRFLKRAELRAQAEQFELSSMSRFLKNGSEAENRRECLRPICHVFETNPRVR